MSNFLIKKLNFGKRLFFSNEINKEKSLKHLHFKNNTKNFSCDRSIFFYNSKIVIKEIENLYSSLDKKDFPNTFKEFLQGIESLQNINQNLLKITLKSIEDNIIKDLKEILKDSKHKTKQGKEEKIKILVFI